MAEDVTVAVSQDLVLTKEALSGLLTYTPG